MTLALTGFERRAAHAAFETIFPGPERGALPAGIRDMDLDGYLDRTLANVPFEASVGLRLAMWVVALAPIFVLHRFVTLASLRVEERERVIAAIYASPYYAIRSAAIALKAIGSILYCGDARVRPAMLAPSESARSASLVVLRRARPAAEESQEAQERHGSRRRIA